MKIKKTITQQVEQEIKLPYFCKYGGNMIAIYDEKTALQVFPKDGYKSVSLSAASILLNDVAKAEPITEAEFLTEYNRIISALCIPDELVYEEPAAEAELFGNWMSEQAEIQNEKLAS